MKRRFPLTQVVGAGLLPALLLWTVTAAAGNASLYERLGGEPAMTRIAKALIDRTATFHQTARSFAESDLDQIVKSLAVQLCDLTDGPCTYGGDSMRDVHAGHAITQSEMYGMVELLEDVLREQDVGLREKNELLALLAPMKRDVVER
jgi:hemoglobin